MNIPTPPKPSSLSEGQTVESKGSDATKASLGRFVFIALQLALVLLVVRDYYLAENWGIAKLLPVIFGGFIVHSALPSRFRLPFFVLLTMLGIGLVLGPTKAVWAIGLGLILIGLCHLPLPFRVRVALVIAVSVMLGLCQAAVIDATKNLRMVIPVIGTIFMFRLVLYLYDIRHERGKVSPWQRIAYFFMLPNPVFPLFPVVDYKTFLRTYYQRDAFAIYQKGVLWMARGAMHLLLYRVVYYFFTPAYEEVTTLAGVAIFALTAYLLYLQISGLFHLAIGILCLFGFDLPETHRLYLLASGFSDYWRRINIYWKDFMAKIVFFPVFMRARKLGQIRGLVIATAVVFFVTWVLHSYQHFWLQGAFPITLVDGLFWGIFGFLVIINTVYQAKKKPVRKARGWSLPTALRLSVQTAAMFVLMCLLWSMWTTPTLQIWWRIVSQAKNEPLAGLLAIAAFLAIGITLGTVAQYLLHRGRKLMIDETSPPLHMGLAVVVPLAAVLALQLPQVYEPLGSREVVKYLRGRMLNKRDQNTRERSYYEGLLVSSNMTSALVQSRYGDDEDGDQRDARMLDPRYFLATGDLLYREYLPSLSNEIRGKKWSTNSFGMRDQEYPLDKPENSVRMMFLGASYIMGKGVADGEPFESVLERRLNAGASEGRSFEIMNMGVDAYTPIEGVLLCRDKIDRFSPDYVFFIDHGSAKLRISHRLVQRMIAPDLDLEFPFLKNLQWDERIFAGTEAASATASLYARAEEVLAWAYGKMVDECNRLGAHPVWVLLPRPRENNTTAELEAQIGLARAAGFTVLVLDDPYRGRDATELTVSKTDFHPNALGHRLIAESFHELLEKNATELEFEAKLKK